MQGVSDPGDYAPIITRPMITRIGHGSMPKPQQLSLQTLASGINDGGWVQIAGTVHSVSQLHSQHWFKLVVGGHSYEMQLPYGANTDALQGWFLDGPEVGQDPVKSKRYLFSGFSCDLLCENY